MKEFARISPALANLSFGGVVVVEPEGFVVLGVAPIENQVELKEAVQPFADALISGRVFSNQSLLAGDLLVPLYPTYTSFLEFYQESFDHVNAPAGTGARIASRLIPNELFQGEANLQKLASGLVKANSAVPLEGAILPIGIFMTTPVHNPDTERQTSVTPAWRNSLWHTIFFGAWASGTPLALQRSITQGLNNANDILVDLAPDSGAYINESNIDEKDHEEAFWGDNVDRLRSIKQQYDPDNFFAVWHGVGWEGADDQDFVCYDKYD